MNLRVLSGENCPSVKKFMVCRKVVLGDDDAKHGVELGGACPRNWASSSTEWSVDWNGPVEAIRFIIISGVCLWWGLSRPLAFTTGTTGSAALCVVRRCEKKV